LQLLAFHNEKDERVHECRPLVPIHEREISSQLKEIVTAISKTLRWRNSPSRIVRIGNSSGVRHYMDIPLGSFPSAEQERL
jgi:hypothetical protein